MTAPLKIATLLCLLLPIVLAASATAAPAQREHVVKAILRDGIAVASDAGVTLNYRDGRVVHSIARGERIPDGTRIEVPARVKIVLVSTGAKSTTTLGPNSSFTPMQTGAGELSSLDRGSAWFSVVRGALDFFQVNHTQRFNASVKGTKFRIDASGRDVTFACTDGSVAVTQIGSILVGSKTVSQVRQVQYVSAAGRREVRYPSFVQYLATFPNFASAKTMFAQQLAQAEASGDAAGVRAGLTNLGLVERYLGEYPAARQAHQRALALYREVGDRDGEGRALNNLGAVERDSGRYAESLQLHQQALAIFRQLLDRPNEAAALSNIGFVLQYMGRYDEALAFDQQALALNRRLGDTREQAGNLINIGNVLYLQGHHNDALVSYQASLGPFRQFGDKDGEGRALSDIGAVSERLGRHAEALASFQSAYAIFEQLGDREGIGATLNNIAIAQSGLGRYNEALATFYQSLTVRHQLGDSRNEAGVYGGISDTEILLRRPQAALEDARRGLALDPNNLRLTLKLANAYLYTGDVASAQAIYLEHRNQQYYDYGSFGQQALNDFKRYRAAGVDTPDVARIEALLRAP